MLELLKQLILGFSNDNWRGVWTFKEETNPDFYHLIYELHEGTLPSDFIFEKVKESLDCIDEALENDDLDDLSCYADGMVSHLNSKLINHFREFPSYADEYLSEFPDTKSVMDLLRGGYWKHCDSILQQVFSFVENEDNHADS